MKGRWLSLSNAGHYQKQNQRNDQFEEKNKLNPSMIKQRDFSSSIDTHWTSFLPNVILRKKRRTFNWWKNNICLDEEFNNNNDSNLFFSFLFISKRKDFNAKQSLIIRWRSLLRMNSWFCCWLSMKKRLKRTKTEAMFIKTLLKLDETLFHTTSVCSRRTKDERVKKKENDQHSNERRDGRRNVWNDRLASSDAWSSKNEPSLDENSYKFNRSSSSDKIRHSSRTFIWTTRLTNRLINSRFYWFVTIAEL
jgi:hypothetical protein